jgi:hypothetical protein
MVLMVKLAASVQLLATADVAYGVGWVWGWLWGNVETASHGFCG